MEVRKLEGATNPEGTAWIVIEREDNLFTIEGNVGKGVQPSFRSRGIRSPELAIKASVAWADLLSIPRLYVRERQPLTISERD
jgi:hypothetical protein